MFYTYIYFTKDDKSIPTYVGKGKGRRYEDHLKPYCKTLFGRHVKNQIAKGIHPVCLITEHATEQIAFAEEIRLIALYGRQDLGLGPLLNLTNGGDGSSGHKCPQHVKDQKSKDYKGRRFYIATDETKARMSESRRKRVITEETRNKLRATMTGKKRGPYKKKEK